MVRLSRSPRRSWRATADAEISLVDILLLARLMRVNPSVNTYLADAHSPEACGDMSGETFPQWAEDHWLRLACSCASASTVMSDPWAAISHDGKLKDGTKERILNALAAQPRTIAQLAELLGVSSPAVHRHVTDLLASGLIAEVEGPQDGRRSRVERYYQPTFPVILAADRAALDPVLQDLAADIATAFRQRQEALAMAFAETSLLKRGESFETLLHYLFATAGRIARAQLEADGALPPWPEHADGSRWVWWAEEAPAREVM
jgi:DNA-binding transcriptional ArsR family regulator